MTTIDLDGEWKSSGDGALMTNKRWRYLRQIAQVLSLGLYLYLFFAALPDRASFPHTDLLFRLDPLTAVGAMLASRSWIPGLALALTTIGLTLLLGRVWCGWICPLGTLLEWFRIRSPKKRNQQPSADWRRVGRFILLVMLAAAILGNLSLLILDPLTLLTRSMSTVVVPGLDQGISSIEQAMYKVPALKPLVNTLEQLLRGTILPYQPQVFTSSFLVAVLFFGVFALNAFSERFWCRYICPLGALLGFLSKVSIFRPFIGESCKACARCSRDCQLDAIRSELQYEIVPADCTLCLDCFVTCAGDDIQLKPTLSVDVMRPHDPSRRDALMAMLTGAIGVAVLKTGMRSQNRHPFLLRPPGVRDENEFLATCLRCSQCIRVCPTSALQPVLSEAGAEGLLTPHLVPRLGYCHYACAACGQACPSGAIPTLDLEEKRAAVIGHATIDRNRCLPWSRGTPCIVCEEMCPIPEKAIRLEEATVVNSYGEAVEVQRPIVLEHLCIGCGVCEFNCLAAGEAAIRVRSL
jgi:MauM/NapG family ferredoxin protein